MTQLELFEMPRVTPPRPRLATIGNLSVRQDHAVLLLMAGLIGCSVIFAAGVERGKRVARAERPLLTPAPVQLSQTTTEAAKQPTAASPSTPGATPRASDRKVAPSPKLSPAPGKKLTTPKALASTPRFAIQVVSYSQPKLAQQELQRLKRRGEPAFLVTKHQHVVLVIGPFPTKAHASARLTQLRQVYRDCFIRSL